MCLAYDLRFEEPDSNHELSCFSRTVTPGDSRWHKKVNNLGLEKRDAMEDKNYRTLKHNFFIHLSKERFLQSGRCPSMKYLG
jgi:predicted molibdopterin-dependent oxidoreductase YjgC